MKMLKLKAIQRALLGLSVVPAMAFSAWVHFDPADTSKVPKLFSQTGFYTSMSTHAVTSEAVAFDVNSPLWSDNAHKYRWVLLKPSTKIKFDPAQDYFDYPEGAVFVKLFKHDTVPGDTTTRIWWETRVLINKKRTDTVGTEPLEIVTHDQWYPFSYKWKRDGSEANLVGIKGEETSINLLIKGQPAFRKWAFPSVKGCNDCHRQYAYPNQGRTVLGFFAQQINRPTAGNVGLNQIRNLFQKNILTWDKAVPTEAELAAMPKWARIEDSSVSLDLRAKAYIAANCSGCHGTRGIPTEAIGHAPHEFNYDFFKTANNALVAAVDLRSVPSQHYDSMPYVKSPLGDTLLTMAIFPGHPELSTILFRMKQRSRLPPSDENAYYSVSAQMPPLGVFEEDTVATRWLAKWITEMPPLGIRNGNAGLKSSAPRWLGNTLILASDSRDQVSLTGLDGRKVELVRVTGNTYRIPSALRSGVYMLRVGNKAYKVVK